MPNSAQHRDKAARNRAFLATIDLDNHHEWGAVVAFYVAVHLVERLRTRLSPTKGQHSMNHQDRLQFVHDNHFVIYHEFRDLYNASLIARYQTIHRFNHQFSKAEVQTLLIDRCLQAIENHVAAIFAPP